MGRPALVENVDAKVAEPKNSSHSEFSMYANPRPSRRQGGNAMSEDNLMTRGTAIAVRPSRRLTSPGVADACYFRSGPAEGGRKALLKITDRCDLRCSHCFVSATHEGSDMSVGAVEAAITRLQEARASNVTLTGGEPLVHPGLLEILDLLVAAGLEVTVCTNGVALTDEVVEHVHELGHVSFNVSVDGITADSHGRFRGRRESFGSTIDNARRLGDAGLLKGVLSTPNTLASPAEYGAVYRFAESTGADYLLMNPSRALDEASAPGVV